MHYNTEGFASAAVASGGTFTLGYPVDQNGYATTPGHYTKARGHRLWVGGHQRMYENIDDFTLSFGASNITVTYNGATTIPAGSFLNLHLDVMDAESVTEPPAGILESPVFRIDLGAPDTADADGVCASQSGTAATAMTINGALASGGVATFDVPRNVVGAWTGTAVMTVTGTDVYGETVVESSASGTTMAGKKAFKTVTSVVPSANITGATVGTGDVLGLPARLPGTGYVLKEMEDGATATAGTVVAAVDTAATATTGDVRGTYDPNSAADGSKSFSLVVAGIDPADAGVAQYAG